MRALPKMVFIFTKIQIMKRLAFCTTTLVLALISCTEPPGMLQEKGKLDHDEISGLEYIKGSGLWALEDSGNESKIYKISEEGKTLESIAIKNAKNNDWEELTSDTEGNLYIGDFGNNDNDRRDLAIYRLDAGKYDSVTAVIAFRYPGQMEFPPKKSGMIYDAEAFFEYKANFYIFSKNRSKGFDGSFNIYKVPNSAGSHEAELLGTMKTCGNYNKCAITGADISPDGKKAVLLSGGKVWLLTDFGEGNFAKAKMKEIELGHVSQKEGICFKDDDTLLIADEKDKGKGGKLYEMKLSQMKH